jgi:sulfite exporter TauE/SafE
VPVDLLTLTAAFLTGLMGSVHCVAMCGGIATGLGVGAGSHPPLARALELNMGRVAGYVLAGALVGALGGGILQVAAVQSLQIALRVALGVAMMLIALRLAGAGDRWNLLARFGAPLWRLMAPLRSRLAPAHTFPRRFALGMLWGWLPCGLSSSLLLVAWLEANAGHGALVMAAFGAGTLPAMVPVTWSGSRLGAIRRGNPRRAVAILVFLAGLATALAPWLVQLPALHGALEALGCRSIVPA